MYRVAREKEKTMAVRRRRRGEYVMNANGESVRE